MQPWMNISWMQLLHRRSGQLVQLIWLMAITGWVAVLTCQPFRDTEHFSPRGDCAGIARWSHFHRQALERTDAYQARLCV